jgi:hypothetical protein
MEMVSGTNGVLKILDERYRYQEPVDGSIKAVLQLFVYPEKPSGCVGRRRVPALAVIQVSNPPFAARATVTPGPRDPPPGLGFFESRTSNLRRDLLSDSSRF